MNLRKAILKDHKHSNNLRLLRSSLWDADLFPKTVCDNILERPGYNMAPLLGLGKSFANKFHNNIPKKYYKPNVNLHRNYSNNRFQRPKQTFREPNQGSTTRQQEFRNKPDTVQEKVPTRGRYSSSGNRGRGQSNRGRGSYTRTSSTNKTRENK